MQKGKTFLAGNYGYAYICNPFKRPDGGTGRRARLKIWLSQGSAGSIPVLGTKKEKPHKVICEAFLLGAINECSSIKKFNIH